MKFQTMTIWYDDIKIVCDPLEIQNKEILYCSSSGVILAKASRVNHEYVFVGLTGKHILDRYTTIEEFLLEWEIYCKANEKAYNKRREWIYIKTRQYVEA